MKYPKIDKKLEWRSSVNKKVSIIVPSYNAGAYIEKFIQCIQNQTYDNWELIIVDDGSNDNTFNIVSGYASLDKRVLAKKRDREPKGSVTCRNIGQLFSSGEYIIHFDADDIVEPFCLEQRVNYMESNPDIEYATFKGASAYENNGEIEYEGRYWGIKPEGDLLSSFLSVNYPFSVWNNIYRSKVFKNIFWDENVKIYTDFSYIVPTILSNKKHSFCENSRIDYLYRVNIPGAMTSNFISDDKYQSTLYLFEKTMKQLEGLQQYPKYRKEFKKYYLLQYERLLVSGAIPQIEDFINYYGNYYSDKAKLQFILYILKNEIKKGRTGNFRRKVRACIYTLCIPKELIKWIRDKK